METELEKGKATVQKIKEEFWISFSILFNKLRNHWPPVHRNKRDALLIMVKRTEVF